MQLNIARSLAQGMKLMPFSDGTRTSTALEHQNISCGTRVDPRRKKHGSQPLPSAKSAGEASRVFYNNMSLHDQARRANLLFESPASVNAVHKV